MTTVTTNKALVLSGESKNAILTLDEQIVNCIGEDAQIIHTGKKAKIYDNEGTEYDEDKGTIKHGKNSLFITTGEESFIEASSKSVAFASGKKAEISYPFEHDESNEDTELNLVKNSVAITTGDEAVICCYASNSVAISTGNDIWIQDLTAGSIGIATGSNAKVGSEGSFKTGAIFGDNSSIIGSDGIYSAFVGGKNCTATIGENGALLSEFPLEELTAGTNSVIVVGWHDGERKRFSTYYQGTDFEGNIEWVTKDPETGKKTKHFRSNTYKTTELGELVLTGTYESEKDISWQKD
ncbi:hypothetical protein [Proteus sp. ZN5]|uniref:hypothetical protein n=1 Tax=Proteus sp. ZN5 TaxID=2697019 RepID=UPI0013E1A718|nr:hypothetical protein [Proteus sp. ZN5]QIG05739.1 hypothetical protein GTK47_10570 [Proteus sp. ZN5]